MLCNFLGACVALLVGCTPRADKGFSVTLLVPTGPGTPPTPQEALLPCLLGHYDAHFSNMHFLSQNNNT